MREVEIQLQKAVLWEEAKGKLRAMVAAQGHRRLCEPMTSEREKLLFDEYLAMEKRIEAFIEEVEMDGLQE